MTENLEEKYFLRKMKMFLIPGGLKLDKSFQTDEIRQAWLWGVMSHVLVQYGDSPVSWTPWLSGWRVNIIDRLIMLVLVWHLSWPPPKPRHHCLHMPGPGGRCEGTDSLRQFYTELYWLYGGSYTGYNAIYPCLYWVILLIMPHNARLLPQYNIADSIQTGRTLIIGSNTSRQRCLRCLV